MKGVIDRKHINIILFIFIIGILMIPSINGMFTFHEGKRYLNILKENNLDDDVEYWALLVAVGVYRDNPSMDRPTMLQEVQRFEQVFGFSENWDESHIKIITKEEATVINILDGFRWLDEMEDENDVCLIYLTTHGFPLWFDRPPFDENDGRDEALATYTGFFPFNPIDPNRWEPMTNPFGIITDDQFNRCFNRLESKGVGVIVDSCHSGGFNDYKSVNVNLRDSYIDKFASSIQGQNRIVVTSVPEADLSYGSRFSHNLIDGLYGYADYNHDNKVTLEEAFYYSEAIVEDTTGMNPQIFDNYPGELVIIEL